MAFSIFVWALSCATRALRAPTFVLITVIFFSKTCINWVKAKRGHTKTQRQKRKLFNFFFDLLQLNQILRYYLDNADKVSGEIRVENIIKLIYQCG